MASYGSMGWNRGFILTIATHGDNISTKSIIFCLYNLELTTYSSSPDNDRHLTRSASKNLGIVALVQ
ncbi:MAG: hypothetical protein V7K26_16275 [Nostoc sp.]|uniref:hypothetical protein n=1 Tax=Nostoc sp. TaxID=1180 RepID=UPI002FF79FE9